MEHLLNSRMSKEGSPTKLENLSPQKFGKAAYASLSYTPSKLVDNVLYKEATSFKRIQEESSKVRESEATISILQDRLAQVQEERDGIQQSLSKQVTMYKKMLNENEVKHEQRVKDIQKSFNQEMQRLAIAKEEEAKYAQSEKQILEARIEELEAQIYQLKDKLEHGGSNFDDLTREHEKLEIHYKNVCDKLQQTEEKLKEDGQKNKAEIEDLNRKIYNNEVDFKGQTDKLQLERERQKQTMQRLHRTELDKVENKRAHEAQVKNQELKDLNETFNAQIGRMNQNIIAKQKNIEALNDNLNEEKEKYLGLTKNSTAQITNLVHDKAKLNEEMDHLNAELAGARQERAAFGQATDKNIAVLEGVINSLKEQIEINHVNAFHDKEKSSLVIDDLHREIIHLKSDNQRAGIMVSQNSMLCKEIRNLKDLLLESSLEMEKCKQEFLRIGREKDHLAVKVRELGYQNETLHRMKFQKQEEARGWRQTYYMNRR